MCVPPTQRQMRCGRLRIHPPVLGRRSHSDTIHFSPRYLEEIRRCAKCNFFLSGSCVNTAGGVHATSARSILCLFISNRSSTWAIDRLSDALASHELNLARYALSDIMSFPHASSASNQINQYKCNFVGQGLSATTHYSLNDASLLSMNCLP